MKKNKESEYESMTIEVIEKRLTGQEKKFVEKSRNDAQYGFSRSGCGLYRRR